MGRKPEGNGSGVCALESKGSLFCAVSRCKDKGPRQSERVAIGQVFVDIPGFLATGAVVVCVLSIERPNANIRNDVDPPLFNGDLIRGG